MEKRILGVILSIVGTVCLILDAVSFANCGAAGRNIRTIIIYSILGVTFFFSGNDLVRNTSAILPLRIADSTCNKKTPQAICLNELPCSIAN